MVSDIHIDECAYRGRWWWKHGLKSCTVVEMNCQDQDQDQGIVEILCRNQEHENLQICTTKE